MKQGGKALASAPLEATLPGFSWRNSGRLTVSAARTNVMLLIRRIVRPSGIPAAVVGDRGALVSSSFPVR